MLNKDFLIIMPGTPSKILQEMVHHSTANKNYSIVTKLDNLTDLKNKCILFAIELGDSGINIELYKILEKIKLSGTDFLENSVGAVFTHSNNELFTRSAARQIILYANMAGCSFPGRPLVEATGSLKNFTTLKKISNKSYYNLCLNSCTDLVNRLLSFNITPIKNPKILVLHASNWKTSNTLMLWKLIKKNISSKNIKEIHIENGTVVDCKGCPYKTCKHYGEQTNCFYGGIMVEEVYPSVLESNILVLLCPNYNDSISSNISAVINRLTALFRKTKFYDKYMYSVIVSGHSGSDIIAEQLISALNINKTFILPPYFAMMETANDAGAVMKNENIEKRAKSFAEKILK